MKHRVVLDTNFLLAPARDGVDIFAEVERTVQGAVEFIVLEGTIRELDIIEKSGSGKDKAAVKLAKTLLKAKSIPILAHEGIYVDDAIVDILQEGDILASLDKRLRLRAKKLGIPLAVLRKGQYVQIIEA